MSLVEGTPRTWTLTGSRHEPAVNEVGGPWLRSGECVEVIEKEPVVDLLERIEEWLQVPDYQSYDHVVTAKATLADVQALLRAYGRLKRRKRMTNVGDGTGVWLCPICGYVDPGTVATACNGAPGHQQHSNELFVEAVFGERLPAPRLGDRFALRPALEQLPPAAPEPGPPEPPRPPRHRPYSRRIAGRLKGAGDE